MFEMLQVHKNEILLRDGLVALCICAP